MVKVSNVRLSIRNSVILEDINADFEKGRIYGLVGRNGSGKTMLMKCICGFLRVSSGEITVEGKRVGKDVDFPESLGMIIEHPGFIMNYSGYRNLKILAGIRAEIGKNDIRTAMETVGLDPDMKKAVRKYSLGMKQRLGIAQAIMENPRLLVLDEPFNGLDNEGVEDMRNFFLKLKEEGTTIILASHSREDVAVLCDEVYEMDKGKIIGCTKKEER